MEGSRLRQYIYSAACALLAVAFACAAPAGAAPPSAFLIATGSASSASSDVSAPASGVQVSRIFDTAGNGDIVSFSKVAPDGTPVSGSVFGLSVVLSLGPSEKASAPRIFAESTADTHASGVSSFASGVPGQTVGVQFDVLGGAEATIAMQSSGATFGSGPFAATPSQGPAVFAFYNFPQAQSGFSLGAFGARAQDVAIAPALAAGELRAPVNASAVSSPLINSFSAQGPFWYNAYSPATRGSSISLSIPFQLARIPVKVRLGEQTLAGVQSSSLANQILGPAFASSAAVSYSAVSGGVTLALPVLSRRATVSLDGLYQTLQQTNQTPFNLAPYAAQPAGAAPGTVVYTPSLADVQQYVGAASVAVPLSSRLTVNGSFSEQLSGNVDLDALTQTLTQRKTGYSGGVAYNFPKTNSSIEFFSNRSVYTGDNLPNYNVTENSQNLYFSVKF